MTTLLAIFLTMSMLVGCSTVAVTDQETAAVTTPNLYATVSQPAPLRYTVELESCADIVLDEDGTELVRYSFQVPELAVWRTDGARVEEPETPVEQAAMEKADAFNRQFKDWIGGEDVRDLTAAAKEERAWRTENGEAWPGAYVLELDCAVYQTGRLVSVTGEYYSYTNGAHPNTSLMAWNFDLDDGSFLTPEHLAAESQEFLETVQREIVRQCRAVAAENGTAAEELFWSDYEEIADDWSSYAVSFDGESMTVAFSPYELACYAAGPQIFTLSYDLLTPCLSDHGREVLGLPTE